MYTEHFHIAYDEVTFCVRVLLTYLLNDDVAACVFVSGGARPR